MAEHRRTRVTRPRAASTTVLWAGALTVLACLAAVTVGVVGGVGRSASPTTADQAPTLQAGEAKFAVRPAEVSRDQSRDSARVGLTPRQIADAARAQQRREQAARERRQAVAATAKAVAHAHTSEWTTGTLNLWTDPAAGRRAGEIATGKRVLLTGRTTHGRTEIVVQRQSRWVTSGYLSTSKPLAAASGLSMTPCPNGSVENGLTSGAVHVYRSVCHAFPQITSYGGWAPRGEHASGKAIDIMTSDVSLGTAIADYLQAHASELDLYDIIWRQHIWTPVRASEGWRSMSDRGSETANHFDHLHVSVN